MSGCGRMNLRLASSYREDGRRRAADLSRRQGMTTDAPKLAIGSLRRSRSVVRDALAALRRLVPRPV